MNVLTRPLVAAVCSLCVLLASAPALGQKFMPAEIVQAENIDAAMQERIMQVVFGPMDDLGRPEPKPDDIKEARERIQGFFRQNQPTDAYLQALSAAIESQMQPVAQHKEPVIRINAMIVLSLMVDAGSEKWIDTGLADKDDAVKRWAMEALGRRMLLWKGQGAAGGVKIDDAIKKIAGIVDNAQPPHPVVLGPALDALVRVDTPRSRVALIDLLNKRVATHAEDPGLSYAPEQSAIENFSSGLVVEAPADIASITGLNRAMFRYTSLIVSQFQANRILAEHEKATQNMLLQCLTSMARIGAAAGADVPVDPNQAKGLIGNGRWEELKALIENEWAKVLVANPFNLKPADLKP